MKLPEYVSFYKKSDNCPDGEIGRRTVFRSQRLHGCAGSNPVLGTKAPTRSVEGFFIWRGASLLARAAK